MKRTGLVSIFLLCNVLVVGMARAVVVANECNNCSNVQLYNQAISLGTGNHYLYDLTQGQITAWQVSREPNGHGGYLYDALELSVDSAYVAAFNKLKTAVTTYGRHTVDSTVTVNLNNGTPGFPQALSNVTAYGVASTSAYRNSITDWLYNLPGGTPGLNALAQSVVGLLGTASTILFKNDAASATINITLTDGSRVTFSWDAGSEPKFTSARDKNNNSIPLTLNQVGGNYLFNGNSNGLPDFVQYLQSLGVPIVNGSITAVGTVTVHCILSPGSTPQCTVAPL